MKIGLLVCENNLAMITFLWRIYRFFCAIEPDMRLAWAQRIHDILKPGGELITLMFPVIILICSLLPFLFSFCSWPSILHIEVQILKISKQICVSLL